MKEYLSFFSHDVVSWASLGFVILLSTYLYRIIKDSKRTLKILLYALILFNFIFHFCLFLSRYYDYRLNILLPKMETISSEEKKKVFSNLSDVEKEKLLNLYEQKERESNFLNKKIQ